MISPIVCRRRPPSVRHPPRRRGVPKGDTGRRCRYGDPCAGPALRRAPAVAAMASG